MSTVRGFVNRWNQYRDPKNVARRRAMRSLDRALASRVGMSPSMRSELEAMRRGL